MNIFQYEFPDMLIKVSSQRKYLEDIASGKIYMNQSGYFRQLEDTYRGDMNDGKCPISLSDLKGQMFQLGPLDGKDEDVIKIPVEWISNFTVGFQHDDKIPLFCCSKLSEDILKKETDFVFQFKEDFIFEMQKFGKYYMLFSLHEFLEQITVYINQIAVGAKCGSVTYRDIFTTYNINMLNDKDRDDYNRFFNKDTSYRWQNEWRLLLVSQAPLIGPDENHYIAEIKPLNWFHIGSINDLKESKIEIKEEPEEN